MTKEKNTKWYQHEILDRTHMLLCMLEEAYGREVDGYHPGIHNKECKKLVKKASKALAELYQKVGEWKEDDIVELAVPAGAFIGYKANQVPDEGQYVAYLWSAWGKWYTGVYSNGMVITETGDFVFYHKWDEETIGAWMKGDKE